MAIIVKAINDLPLGKSPGPDGLVAEFFKQSIDISAPIITSLCNTIIASQDYPDQWATALLVPVYKKGPLTDPANYRGISLLPIMSKIFTKCVSSRMLIWAENNQKLYEEQCGFRKGKSTIDQAFTLQSLIQKYLSKKRGRFYCLFVDFTKAFDSVSHSCLWYKLLVDGAHGRLLHTLRSMYNKLKSSVITPEGITEFFHVHIGVRQGCQLSTFLFNHYLNELVDLNKYQGGQGAFVSEIFPNIMLLLYADDLIQCTDTVGRLQKLITILEGYCDKWGLNINLSKTKIMVFRNGGPLKKNEKWFYKGNELEHVSFYRYLGITFTVKLIWTCAQKMVAAQGMKTLNFIKHIYYKCNGLPPDIIIELMEKMVKPVITYGAEIWGLNMHKCIEDVQVKSGRFILGLPSSSPRAAVLGDCGLTPIRIDCIIKAIKYWLRLIKLDETILCKSAYLMLYKLDTAGRKTWAGEVRQLLESLGFNEVWEAQQIGNENIFLHELKSKLLRIECENWQTVVSNNNRLTSYRQFKSVYKHELYVNTLSNLKLRRALARLRTSSHSLRIETGRHIGTPQHERICIFGKDNSTVEVI